MNRVSYPPCMRKLRFVKELLLTHARGGAKVHGLALYVAGGEGKIKLFVCTSLAMM